MQDRNLWFSVVSLHYTRTQVYSTQTPMTHHTPNERAVVWIVKDLHITSTGPRRTGTYTVLEEWPNINYNTLSHKVSYQSNTQTGSVIIQFVPKNRLKMGENSNRMTCYRQTLQHQVTDNHKQNILFHEQIQLPIITSPLLSPPTPLQNPHTVSWCSR